jgi:DNA-binding CsgD family transcriptional regulator
MTNIQLPAGLIDNNVELFKTPDAVMATHLGVVKPLLELPSVILDVLKKEMHSHPSILKALKLSGFTEIDDQLEKFAECRFGGFDMTPDFKDGKFSESEYHECGFRGSCDMEGIVCNFFKVNGQLISPFEINMVKLLATDDIQPVIAEKLNVSMNTFETKKQRLFEKLGVQSRPRLVAICFELQILSSSPCIT